jgi:hypothetical protein
MTAALLVGSCTACGFSLRAHRDDQNRSLSCVQLVERQAEISSQAPFAQLAQADVDDQVFDAVRQRIAVALGGGR